MKAPILAVVVLAAVLPANGQVVKGFGISPKGFPLDYGQLPAFYAEVAAMPHGGVLWNGAWRDDAVGGSDAGTVPAGATATLESSVAYGFIPAVIFGWRSGNTLFIQVPSDKTNDWTNADAKHLFVTTVSNFAAAYRPPFLFLGNENDFYYERNPADYANWIGVYDAAYDAIKGASPKTLVGPVFSYEHMAGLGALNGWTKSQWPALQMHDVARVDLVGITLYPWLNFATAAAVPSDYLDPLLERIASKPIAITETGWPAENLGGLNPPWETSESAQSTYLVQLAAVLRGKPVRMVNHLFLNAMKDPGGSPLAWKLFGSVSIRDTSGNPRAMYGAWVAFLRAKHRAARH